ncbi:hypothetical protein [Azospirillum sp. SYSU D00513]|uniref:hypothetical protein n=1 Tax=Azospirillum sp. SYSU D00513 TaxID=2812561 RepID=UPI001A95BF21|nr:hypothetical protein [Azospirillum sp. SYSU D00513]
MDKISGDIVRKPEEILVTNGPISVKEYAAPVFYKLQVAGCTEGKTAEHPIESFFTGPS